MPTQPSLAQSPTAPAQLNLLTFTVAGQLYGIPVAKIIRIIEMVTITPLPDAPPNIQGIINLHGQAVPVMDLRLRFGVLKPVYGLRTPIVLVNAAGPGEPPRSLGLVVDSVQQVISTAGSAVEAAATVMPGDASARGAYLLGLVKMDRQMILLLNLPVLWQPAPVSLAEG